MAIRFSVDVVRGFEKLSEVFKQEKRCSCSYNKGNEDSGNINGIGSCEDPDEFYFDGMVKAFIKTSPDSSFSGEAELSFQDEFVILTYNFKYEEGKLTEDIDDREEGTGCPECGYDGEPELNEDYMLICPKCGADMTPF